MGLTYTRAVDRDRLHGAVSLTRLRGHAALVVTGLVSLAAIAVCHSGRWRAFEITEAKRGTVTPLNLNAGATPAHIEAALAPIIEVPADRRFAAAAVARALDAAPPGTELTHVGALSRFEVSARSIERTRGLVTLPGRLRDLGARASAAGADPSTAVTLFSTAEVTALKPAFIVRDRRAHTRTVIWCTLAFLGAFQLVPLFWRWRGMPGDAVMLGAVHLLVTFGFLVVLSRQDPLRDTLLVARYTQGVVLGLAACLIVSFLDARRAVVLQLSYLALAGAVLLSIALAAFGTGPGTSGVKVNLGPVQPIEVIRPLIACFLAGYLGRRWELLRQLREGTIAGREVPGWLNIPRLDYLLPVVGGVGLALLLFFALRDLGPALLLSLLVLAMLAIARAGIGIVLFGVGLLASGITLGYWLDVSRTLAVRVAMWSAPWENAVRGGDQIAHGLWALAAGAMSGTGLGLGDVRYIPAGHTDLPLAAVGEELGAAGVLIVAMACAVVAWRGLRIARRAPTDTTFFLAVAMTLSLVTPVLVMAAGLLGLLPLTGVVTPFVSYGGSAMVANFASLGLLIAIGAHEGDRTDRRSLQAPLRWLGGALATAAIVVLIAWSRVQVLAADQVLVRPQLSVQADGGLRFQYNPRVLDAARRLPRGTVLDRREVPIAAERRVAQEADPTFARMRISLKDACPSEAERCYPLGGAAFHVLGDANAQLNWPASNTSYVERDAEDGLRGFNDRATVVATGNAGSATTALRRDYRDLVPLVRHRWEPNHPAVAALLTHPRDVHVTIDARLQKEIAAIVARTANAARLRRGAAVVLDAATGEVLASVSLPWPSLDGEHPPDAPDVLLDRARYGLYPPGSTFKLLTAAAALRRDPESHQQSFACVRLPDGRIGAKVPGWSRPVRDDVLDQHAHGTLTMHDGLVRSCNAYFAQLAVQLGAARLASTAALAGISYPIDGPAARVRENLPYSGYGQGDVLATPLRMARVAAAISSGGIIREPSMVRDGLPIAERSFLSPTSARLLSTYMRDVVTTGTGRRLRDHAVPIAGKTGTAEVDKAASHAWFVGFAPAGPATQRIAFAVLFENAGYGGATAAAAAGDIVTAAASLGYVR